MRHLYEITDEYRDLLEGIYETTADGDGTIGPEQSAYLERLGGELTDKIDACCRVLRDLEATKQVCELEADRLKARASAVGKNVDWLKGYIKRCLEAAHVDKLDAGPFRVSIRQSPERVDVYDLDAVPHDFDVPQERKVALSTIKERLKMGQEIPGAQLVRGTHLTVK